MQLNWKQRIEPHKINKQNEKRKWQIDKLRTRHKSPMQTGRLPAVCACVSSKGWNSLSRIITFGDLTLILASVEENLTRNVGQGFPCCRLLLRGSKMAHFDCLLCGNGSAIFWVQF